jgi:benzoyl-CoA reductase/2-hydroxyglutaryl-CoA dehydratase subunit BcrC/BadD/HgdB
MSIAGASVIMRACAGRLAEELEALRAWRSGGGRVAGYTCHAFPAAAAAGLGLWPVRLLCGASVAAEAAGERLVRPDVCPHVKSLIGNLIERRGLHAEVDLWVGLQTCDQMRRGLYLLSEELSLEVHPIQLPATRTLEAAGYFALQVERFCADVEAIHGMRFDPAKALKWRSEQTSAAAVLALAARSAEVSPLDLHAMFHLFFVARPEGLFGFYERLIASAPPFKGARRVVLAGGPLALEDTVVLEALEAGGVGAVPLNCTGLNTVTAGAGEEKINGANEGGDYLPRALAIESFNLPPCARARPNTAVFQSIAETLASTGASGLIVKCLRFCDHWYTERVRMAQAFDLPVLVLDSDYAGGGRERLMGRVEAFIETMG